MSKFLLKFLATIDSFCHLLHLIRVNDCLNATAIPLHDVFVMPVAHSVLPLYPVTVLLLLGIPFMSLTTIESLLMQRL